MTKATLELKDIEHLMHFILDYCIDLKMNTDDSIAPFSMLVDHTGTQSLHILDNGGINTADELFDKAIRKAKPEAAILVIESTMNHESKVMPAILLKVYQNNKPDVKILAQAYSSLGHSKLHCKKGALQLMGSVPNYHYKQSGFSLSRFMSLFL